MDKGTFTSHNGRPPKPRSKLFACFRLGTDRLPGRALDTDYLAALGIGTIAGTGAKPPCASKSNAAPATRSCPRVRAFWFCAGLDRRPSDLRPSSRLRHTHRRCLGSPSGTRKLPNGTECHSGHGLSSTTRSASSPERQAIPKWPAAPLRAAVCAGCPTRLGTREVQSLSTRECRPLGQGGASTHGAEPGPALTLHGPRRPTCASSYLPSIPRAYCSLSRRVAWRALMLVIGGQSSVISGQPATRNEPPVARDSRWRSAASFLRSLEKVSRNVAQCRAP